MKRTRDDYRPPTYRGEQKPRTEDLTGPAPTTEGRIARENRGKRAPSEGSGAVVGSGAAAGGGGGFEDYDADPQGGGGHIPLRGGRPAD